MSEKTQADQVIELLGDIRTNTENIVEVLRALGQCDIAHADLIVAHLHKLESLLGGVETPKSAEAATEEEDHAPAKYSLDTLEVVRCTLCDKVKPVSEFRSSNLTTDRPTVCRDCVVERNDWQQRDEYWPIIIAVMELNPRVEWSLGQVAAMLGHNSKSVAGKCLLDMERAGIMYHTTGKSNRKYYTLRRDYNHTKDFTEVSASANAVEENSNSDCDTAEAKSGPAEARIRQLRLPTFREIDAINKNEQFVHIGTARWVGEQVGVSQECASGALLKMAKEGKIGVVNTRKKSRHGGLVLRLYYRIPEPKPCI